MTFMTYYKYAEKRYEARKTAHKVVRKGLIKILRNLKITNVTAQYCGGGDSGEVYQIEVKPEQDLASNLNENLIDFLWEVAYSANPGFENNDGGEGSVDWDIIADSITVEHGQHYQETEWSTTEDL